MGKLVLITGGARSGKSTYAQELAAATGKPVMFVATALPGDDDMRERIAAHRRSRPANWRTLEATRDVAAAIRAGLQNAGVVLIDCITVLIGNIFFTFGEDPEVLDYKVLEALADREINSLLDVTAALDAVFMVVTNEVGLGTVPGNRMARLYRDILGRANRTLAARADEVEFLVAGIPVKIKPKQG